MPNDAQLLTLVMKLIPPAMGSSSFVPRGLSGGQSLARRDQSCTQAWSCKHVLRFPKSPAGRRTGAVSPEPVRLIKSNAVSSTKRAGYTGVGRDRPLL